MRLFAGDNHAEIEVTWSVCQDIITAYCNADRAARTTTLRAVIDSISSGVHAGLVELRKLGRTMNKRVVDVLAYFERLGTLKSPTEAINGLVEHLG